MRSEAEDLRQELIEHVANADEQLGELFLGKYEGFFQIMSNSIAPRLYKCRSEFSPPSILLGSVIS